MSICRNIIVIDDSMDTLELIEANLSHRYGYTVHSESSAESAFARLRNLDYQVDLILLDYRMPGINGLEFYRTLLEKPGIHIPVIMLTASETTDLAVAFMKMGGADFIVKPILNFDILDVAIQRALAETENRKQLNISEAARIAAERSNKFMEEFIAKLSHELGTPSHHMASAIHLVKKSLDSGDLAKAEKWLNTAEASNARLKRLVKDIFDLSQIQKGKFSVIKANTLLNEIARNAITEVVSQNPSFHGQIETDLNEISAPCDSDRISQVFVNLLNNSMRYAPESKIITVSVKTENNHALCSISDQGPGIPEDTRNLAFNPFFQCKNGFNHSGTLGLGLSISKEIVERHGGSISALPNEPQGAKLIFTLPLTEGGAA